MAASGSFQKMEQETEKGAPKWEELLMRSKVEFSNPRSYLPGVKLSVTELETASLDLTDGQGFPSKTPAGGVYHAYYEMFQNKGFHADDLENEINSLPVDDDVHAPIQEHPASSHALVSKDKRKRPYYPMQLQHQQQRMVDHFPYFPARVGQEIPFDAFELAVRVGVCGDEYFEPTHDSIVRMPPVPRAIWGAAEGEGKLLIVVFWRPNYRPSLQAVTVFKHIQQKYPKLVSLVGVLEPRYKADLDKGLIAEKERPASVVVDHNGRLARDLSVNLGSASSTGLPAVILCLPGNSGSSGVKANASTQSPLVPPSQAQADCYKAVIAFEGRKVVSRNCGRATSAMLSAYAANCDDNDRQTKMLEAARDVETMEAWSTPFWSTQEQWSKLRNQEVASTGSASSIATGGGDTYSSFAARTPSSKHSIPALPPSHYSNSSEGTTEHKGEGSASASGEGVGFTGALVGGVMALLGGKGPQGTMTTTSTPFSPPPPAITAASTNSDNSVPSYARTGPTGSYTQEQLRAVQLQRDKLMELQGQAQERSSAEYEGREEDVEVLSSERDELVTMDRSDLDPAVQLHFGLVQGLLRACVDKGEAQKNHMQNFCKAIAGMTDDGKSPHGTPGGWGEGAAYREQYSQAYSGLWAFLDSVVNVGGTAGNIASAGHFLPYLHHKLHAMANSRMGGKSSGITAKGRADVQAYELMSNRLCAGALYSLERKALETTHSRYGDTGGGDYLRSVQVLVQERRQDRLYSSASPSPSGGSSSGKTTTNDSVGGLRWDYVYYYLRHGLYSEAEKEISTVTHSGESALLSSSGKSRSSNSQTRAGRERERMRDAARREAQFLSHACLIVESLASNHSAASLKPPSTSTGSNSLGSHTGTPGPSSSHGEQNSEIDLTSEAMIAAVSGVKDYYHSYLYAQSVQQAEQRYNATHDTHHHSHHAHNTRRNNESMDAYKELVIMIIAFADHTSVLALLHSIEGPRLTGDDVLWVAMYLQHFSRRLLVLSPRGYEAANQYEEELQCCIDLGALYENVLGWEGESLASGSGGAMRFSSSTAPFTGANESSVSINVSAITNTPYALGMSPRSPSEQASWGRAGVSDRGDDRRQFPAYLSESQDSDPFLHTRTLLCCQQYSAAVSFLRERGEVLAAVHLAVSLLYYGLLHSEEPLLKQHLSRSGSGRMMLDMVPTDATVASFLLSYAFPPAYPFVSLSYLLMLVLPQSAPSMAHFSSALEASSTEGTLVVRDGGSTNTNDSTICPLLLSDIAVFAEALETLFHQVDSREIVEELVETLAREYFVSFSSCSGGPRGTLISVLRILGHRALSVHREVGDAVLYYQLAEQHNECRPRRGDSSDIKDSLPEALLAALQQLSVQLQEVVRPSAGGAGSQGELRAKTRSDCRKLLDDCSSTIDTQECSHEYHALNIALHSSAASGNCPLSLLERISRVCCVLRNLEACCSFLDLCKFIDSRGSSLDTRDTQAGGNLEIDVLALVEDQMKPLCWSFLDLTRGKIFDENNPDLGVNLLQVVVTLPLLPANEDQSSRVMALLDQQPGSSTAIYADILQHCSSYLQRLLAYVQQGYGSSYTADTDRRLVNDMRGIVRRIEAICTAFR